MVGASLLGDGKVKGQSLMCLCYIAHESTQVLNIYCTCVIIHQRLILCRLIACTRDPHLSLLHDTVSDLGGRSRRNASQYLSPTGCAMSNSLLNLHVVPLWLC